VQTETSVLLSLLRN